MPEKIFIFLLIVSVGSITFLGLSSAGLMDHTTSRLCPVSAILGGNCPTTSNVLAFLSHHATGLQSVVQGAFSASISIAVFSILLLVSLFAVSFDLFQGLSHKIFSHIQWRVFELRHYALQERMLHWFALHNKQAMQVWYGVHVKT